MVHMRGYRQAECRYADSLTARCRDTDSLIMRGPVAQGESVNGLTVRSDDPTIIVAPSHFRTLSSLVYGPVYPPRHTVHF